jgi:hypothetical protein
MMPGEDSRAWWRRNPWVEFAVYMVVFAVMGAVLYGLKMRIKGPQRPTHVPFDSTEQPQPVGGR